MFFYYLNTFVCCCIRNLNFLFRAFLFMLLVSRPFLFMLLVSFSLNHLTTPRMHKILVCQFCAVGIFQFESFDYSTRAQNFGVNFVGIILQLNACKKNLVANFVG